MPAYRPFIKGKGLPESQSGAANKVAWVQATKCYLEAHGTAYKYLHAYKYDAYDGGSQIVSASCADIGAPAAPGQPN